MQPDQAEVARLVHRVVVVEEQAQRIGGVVALRRDPVMADELDVGIGVGEQRDQPFGHRAGQLAAMQRLELHRIGEPADSVADLNMETPAFYLLNGGLDLFEGDISGGAGDADRIARPKVGRDKEDGGRSFFAGCEGRMNRVGCKC